MSSLQCCAQGLLGLMLFLYLYGSAVLPADDNTLDVSLSRTCCRHMSVDMYKPFELSPYCNLKEFAIFSNPSTLEFVMLRLCDQKSPMCALISIDYLSI